jgi:ABC-2 type transport system permease protein
VNATIMRLAVRALAGQRRGLLLVGLPLLLVVTAAVLHALTGEPVSARLVVLELGMALVVPLVALLAANGVLGPEIDDGSVVYLLSTPVSRYAVAASKFLVAAAVSVVLGGGGLAATALAGGLSSGWLLSSALLGSVAAVLYTALFTAMSAATRHGMIAGLVYVLIIEGLMAAFLVGMRFVSVQSLTQRLVDLLTDVDIPAVDLSSTYAVVASMVVLVVGVLLAGWRLQRFQLRGDE